MDYSTSEILAMDTVGVNRIGMIDLVEIVAMGLCAKTATYNGGAGHGRWWELGTEAKDAFREAATALLDCRSPAEMEDLTLQICFDKVVKERDALRTQVEGAAKELADARFHLLSNRTLEADRAIGRALSKITSTDGEKT